MADWPELPGVTVVDGRGVLPAVPAQVVRGLGLAIDGARMATARTDLVEGIHREARVDRLRAEGLARWLPLSHVARWTAEGTLLLDPQTDLADLGLRYSAWVATRPVPAENAEATRTYARAVTELAQDAARERAPDSLPPFDLDARAEPPPAPPPLLDPAVTARIRALISSLDAAFFERRVQVRLSLLAILAGQHVLLLGPPGTAKSALARALCQCFVDARYFEYLLSRFTHPDELFGPVSIPGLKDEDYRRLTEGFLPQAHIAFLDEIFKANSAILNSLLTIVNERVFHHGRHRDAVPLIGMLGASNELPDPEGGLEALYDRFLVRVAVPPVGTPESFLGVATGMAAAPRIPPDARLTIDDLVAIRSAAERVEVSPAMSATLVALWRRAGTAEWGVSDRRWRQAVGLLKVAAATAGRSEVIPLDLLVLEHVLATTPDKAVEVRETVLDLLGSRAVPDHDLRAQWLLLKMDRVAPVGPLRPVAPRVGGAHAMRVIRRRENLQRFLAHHRRAVEALAADRERIEAMGEQHPWLASMPPQVVANHLAAARDLARILQVAERYRSSLETLPAAARALVMSLPESSKRKFGFSSVCILKIAEADLAVGLTLGGEREDLPAGETPANAATNVAELPVVATTAKELMECVEGALEQSALLRGVPVYAMRPAATALGAMVRELDHDPVPPPPPLPPPPGIAESPPASAASGPPEARAPAAGSRGRDPRA